MYFFPVLSFWTIPGLGYIFKDLWGCFHLGFSSCNSVQWFQWYSQLGYSEIQCPTSANTLQTPDCHWPCQMHPNATSHNIICFIIFQISFKIVAFPTSLKNVRTKEGALIELPLDDSISLVSCMLLVTSTMICAQFDCGKPWPRLTSLMLSDLVFNMYIYIYSLKHVPQKVQQHTWDLEADDVWSCWRRALCCPWPPPMPAAQNYQQPLGKAAHRSSATLQGLEVLQLSPPANSRKELNT